MTDQTQPDRTPADPNAPHASTSEQPTAGQPAIDQPAGGPAAPAPFVVGAEATPIATAATPPGAAELYSPTPSPAPGWQRAAWAADAQPTPEAWFEPAATPVAAPALQPVSKRRGGGAVALVLSASLVSAVLASGGTYLALSASGALDQPPPPAPTAIGDQVSAKPLPVVGPSAVVDVATKVSPAVVTIVSTGVSQSQIPLDIPQEGIGSGVIFDSNGWILTNKHVVAGSGTLTVRLNDGRSFDGTIYGIDTLTDLAIVKVDATGLPTAPTGDSSSIKVGQLAIAIGSPLGTYTNSVTSGIISALGRSIQVEGGTINNLIQTDGRSIPGTAVDRSSTPPGTSSESTPRSPRAARGSGSPSRSTSLDRSWSRPSPASSLPAPGSASATSRSTSSSRRLRTFRSTTAPGSPAARTRPARRRTRSSPAAPPTRQGSRTATLS